MSASPGLAIQSEGDLEVVILDEAHGALAQIIGPWLYEVRGTAPRQTAYFHDPASFDLFLILAGDFADEGSRSAKIGGKYQNWSLLKGLVWLSSRYPLEAKSSGLDKATQRLQGWMDHVAKIQFWCPAVGKNITLSLSNRQLTNLAANSAKHSILRLSMLLTKLGNHCTREGHNFQPQELVPVLRAMNDELRGRFEYYATLILGLMGRVFLALNTLIVNRHAADNACGGRKAPGGLTSDIYRDLYNEVMAFKRYPRERIESHTPVTDEALTREYHPVT
jgi:hypothetical protein